MSDGQKTTPLERAMAEFFETDSVAELDWVNNDRSHEWHGRYLAARWLGMGKWEAYEWVNE